MDRVVQNPPTTRFLQKQSFQLDGTFRYKTGAGRPTDSGARMFAAWVRHTIRIQHFTNRVASFPRRMPKIHQEGDNMKNLHWLLVLALIMVPLTGISLGCEAEADDDGASIDVGD